MAYSPDAGVPHARGDGPRYLYCPLNQLKRSPRTWGWTETKPSTTSKSVAFPTHVGMDRSVLRGPGTGQSVPHARGDGPQAWAIWVAQTRVPHARGDGPLALLSRITRRWRSPRTWGWTVIDDVFRDAVDAFPTHVGMDRLRIALEERLQRVPHARGDGPPAQGSWPGRGWRSPRTWGWTGLGNYRRSYAYAFPTHVGMDRSGHLAGRYPPGVPHARGDGPQGHGAGASQGPRSPRTWGWTADLPGSDRPDRAFPTHVGMDRD